MMMNPKKILPEHMKCVDTSAFEKSLEVKLPVQVEQQYTKSTWYRFFLSSSKR